MGPDMDRKMGFRSSSTLPLVKLLFSWGEAMIHLPKKL